jgi:Tfp pilus assembly protein PilX
LDRSVRVRGGFTLVITIMLMVLIAVLAVAMLSLSVISLRTSGQAQALSVAQNNARLGLMLAIGDLQSSLGPDKAISA